jgi:hypothetical protein
MTLSLLSLKNESRLMRPPCSLCVCITHPINFQMREPLFVELGMYIMAPEPLSSAYFMNPSISLCFYMCISLPLTGTGSVKTLPWQQTHRIVEHIIFCVAMSY